MYQLHLARNRLRAAIFATLAAYLLLSWALAAVDQAAEDEEELGAQRPPVPGDPGSRSDSYRAGWDAAMAIRRPGGD